MGRQKRMSLLLHPFRRDLYTVLCENPGTYLIELVNMLESPLGTLTWHLRILEREGLVKSIKFAGKRLYYPTMLRTKQAEMAFLTLRSDIAKKIFQYIVNHPSCYQEEMAEKLDVHHDTVKWHVSRMEEIGLVRVEKEGRTKKHYLASLGEALLAGSLNTISETFVLFLIEKLKDVCLNPEIREKTPERVTIRIDCPDKGQDCFITIKLNEWQFEFISDNLEPDGEHASSTSEIEKEEVHTL
ncbi:MAG: winged helix-turn-helix transcriptional regulator [Candidatus Thorarchaeota archaeon]|nr:winged helix-turn-helix transcriptional regulator [Candidatus Thorarchaeota archaeon]